MSPPSAPRTTIADLLAAARGRLRRLDPVAARDAMDAGAILVDIRSERQRERDGVIPGARFVPRNVLEWRVDPASSHCDPVLAERLDRHLIVVCDEGYQSSLAAATLQNLGFRNATDLDGGFQAWRAAGLPVQPVCDPAGTRSSMTHQSEDKREQRPERERDGDDRHNELGYRNVDEEAEHDERGSQGPESREPPARE